MKHIRLKGFQILKESIGTRHVADPDLPRDPHQFNEAIGLPIHPATNLPHRLMPYQEYVIEYSGKDLAINKANKVGITEAFLRKLTFMGVVGDCGGYQIMLGAQDRNLAIENMRRLQVLFDDSDLLRPLVKRRIITKLELWNGTVYFVMPRTAKGMRGWPRLKVAFMDEAAHYGLLDDEPILAATTARLANTDGYLFLASTPQGQRGFFSRVMDEIQSSKILTGFMRNKLIDTVMNEVKASLEKRMQSREFQEDLEEYLPELKQQAIELATRLEKIAPYKKQRGRPLLKAPTIKNPEK